jgi:hypothetical protein
MAEYHDGDWAVRFAEPLLPKIATEPNLEYRLGLAHAEDLEVERRVRLGSRDWTVRRLGYENRANTGNYHEAIDQYLAGQMARPDITDHPRQTRTKYGTGLIADIAVAPGLRARGVERRAERVLR